MYRKTIILTSRPARQIPPDRAGGKLVDEQRFFRSDGVISIGGLRLRRWHQCGATRSQRRRRDKSPPATKGLGPECRGPSHIHPRGTRRDEGGSDGGGDWYVGEETPSRPSSCCHYLKIETL